VHLSHQWGQCHLLHQQGQLHLANLPHHYSLLHLAGLLALEVPLIQLIQWGLVGLLHP
jgi:hypothetical protein